MSDVARPSPHRQTTIFIVEDDLGAARFTSLALDKAGYHTEVFSNPSDALIATTRRGCSLILSDVRMPGMSGIELLKQVRRGKSGLPVILMSAHVTVADTIVALRHGASDYLLKPLTVQSLTRTVGSVLAATPTCAERVLAIGAHPDDVEIGVGGTLNGHVRRGDQVTILTLSCGESGGAPLTRLREAQRAAELLGAELVVGSLPDTRIAYHGATVELIERVVDEVNPTTVYMHSRNDVHQDHRAAHQASLIANRSVSRLLSYQSPSATVEFAPNRFVTIDCDLEQKLLSIGAYRSQIQRCGYLAEDLLRATTRYWGRFGTGCHAEPLEVVRDRVEPDELPRRARQRHAIGHTNPRKEESRVEHAS